MNDTSEPGRRIVSKSDYLLVQGRRAWLWTKAAGITIACGGGLVLIMWAMHWNTHFAIDWLDLILRVGGLFALVCAGVVIKTLDEIRDIEPVAPLTHANTGCLPAHESLVRASEEPAQTQQAVLLRPSMETQERHEEQLLRASAGE